MIAEGAWKKHRRPFQKEDTGVPRCWGATYTLPRSSSRRRWLPLLCAGLLAALVVLLALRPAADEGRQYPAVAAVEVTPERLSVRPNSAVVYRYPADSALKQYTFTREQLLHGRLMLIDDEHPLPPQVPVPNTLCIAAHGKGVIPVRDMTLKSSAETIAALYQLFYDARQKGVEGLVVYRATLSEAEQREWQLERARIYSASLPLSEAAALAQQEVDNPGRSEHQQGYAVDIRLYASWNGAVDERPLARTDQGRYLLQNAWRYGFIQRYPNHGNEDKANHFRYIGMAHSTAITYLGLTVPDYIELLHERDVIQIHENGAPRYLIVCKAMQGDYVDFMLPEQADYEISLDNAGYAVVACTYR